MEHKHFNPKNQYGDTMYIERERWPLSASDLKHIIEWTVLIISNTVPQKYHDKIVYFTDAPPDVEVYSDKDPEAAKLFNMGHLSWKYPGEEVQNGL